MLESPPPSYVSDPVLPENGKRRWIVVLTLSLLLHLLLIGWGSDSLRWPTPHAPTQAVLDVSLLTPPRPTPAPLATPEPQAKPPAKPKPRTRAPAQQPVVTPAPPPVAAVEPEPEPVIVPAPATAPPVLFTPVEPDNPYSVPTEPRPSIPVVNVGIGTGAGGASNAASNPLGTAENPVTSATNPAPTADAPPHYQINPPPSVTLKYDVEALREGQRVYGHGSIIWRTDGHDYTIDGDAGILFFSVLSFKSDGLIDEFGVAPVLYSEKRFRKSATNTHFQRERNRISFSASTTSYPRQGGEQDRASVIWQLASIGRGDSSRFAAGTDIDLFVAGARDAETWRFHIIGQENLDLDGQPTAAWHVVRTPRPGSYDQQIDIWLAPTREWYPVKLRYTETNGDYLDLLLSNIKPPPATVDPAPTQGTAAEPTSAGNPASNHDWIN